MKKTFAVRIDDSERQALEELAEKEGVAVSDLIRAAIDNLLLETRMNGGVLFLMAKEDAGLRFLAEETLQHLAMKHGSLKDAPANHPLKEIKAADSKKPVTKVRSPSIDELRLNEMPPNIAGSVSHRPSASSATKTKRSS
jgi:predicted transcriptional regulator